MNPATAPIPARWSWHYQALVASRDRLTDAQNKEYDEAREHAESHSWDLADSGNEEYDHDLAYALLSHQQDALEEIDAALARIGEGRYGICEECGVPIPAERLRAVPWTRYTAEVQRQRENAKAVTS